MLIFKQLFAEHPKCNLQRVGERASPVCDLMSPCSQTNIRAISERHCFLQSLSAVSRSFQPSTDSSVMEFFWCFFTALYVFPSLITYRYFYSVKPSIVLLLLLYDISTMQNMSLFFHVSQNLLSSCLITSLLNEAFLKETAQQFQTIKLPIRSYNRHSRC